MKGVESLVEARSKGRLPMPFVFIETDDDNRLQPWRDWWAIGGVPTLLVEKTDSLARLDMRCVVGLQVHVDGCDAKRVQAVRDACVRDGAVRAITNLSRINARGEKEVVSIHDGEVILWQRS